MDDKAGDGGQSQDKGGTGDSIQVQIGDDLKVLTKDEVITMLDKADRLGKQVEGYSSFSKVLTQYGISADEYTKNSEAAFAVVNDLINRGIIDEQGNVIEKKSQDKQDPSDGGKIIPSKGDLSRQDSTVLKAIQSLVSKVEELESGQSAMFRRNIERDVKDKHSNLDSKDVAELLATAQRDKSKTFWDHASALSKAKEAREGKVRMDHMKDTIQVLAKIGALKEGAIDMSKLDSLDLNSLKEQEPGGGMPTFEGKKFMFGSRMRRLGKNKENVKDVINPSEGMTEILKHSGG